jgi:hypothetical protein
MRPLLAFTSSYSYPFFLLLLFFLLLFTPPPPPSPPPPLLGQTGKLVISPPEQKKKEKRTEPLRLPKIAGAGHAVAGFVKAFSGEKPHPGL